MAVSVLHSSPPYPFLSPYPLPDFHLLLGGPDEFLCRIRLEWSRETRVAVPAHKTKRFICELRHEHFDPVSIAVGMRISENRLLPRRAAALWPALYAADSACVWSGQRPRGTTMGLNSIPPAGEVNIDVFGGWGGRAQVKVVKVWLRPRITP